MPRTVLIGFAEALAAAETVFSLRRAGFRIEAFCRTGARPLIARHLPIERLHEIEAPERDLARSLSDLSDALNHSRSIDVILALDDPSLFLTRELAESRDLTDCIAIASAIGEQAGLALDKSRQIALARNAGFRLPDTVIANTRGELSSAHLAPCIIKPALAAQRLDNRLSKGRAFFAMTDADLEAVGEQPNLAFPVLAQRLVEGTGEGVFGFAHAGGVSAWSGHRRLRMMDPNGSGASACRSLRPSSSVVQAAERFVAAAAWRGPFMIELLRSHDGAMYFMELNGRLWGSTALARRGGFEYPAWAVQLALDPDFAPPDIELVEGCTARHLGRDLVHLMMVLRGPRSPFHARTWPGLWTSAKRVFTPGPRKGFYNYDPDHPNYFILDALDQVWRKIRKRS